MSESIDVENDRNTFLRILALKTSHRLSIILLILLAPRPGLLPAGEWPQWRGPEGVSVSRETGLPVSWSEEEGILWKRPLPGWGDSTPAVWGDAVFVTSQEGEKLLVLRISKKTGEVLWQREAGTGATGPAPGAFIPKEERGSQKFHVTHNLASPSPVTDGERVVVHFGSGLLAAYDFDGNLAWSRNLQDDHGTYTIWWGHANSPVIHGDLVISVCMQDSLVDLGKGPAPSYVVAHDKRTGKEVWKTPRMTGAKAEECDAYTTPLLRRTAEGVEAVIAGGTWIDAYDPASGSQRWVLKGLGGNRTITGPTLAHDMLFTVVGMRGPLLGVKLGGKGELPQDAIAWRHKDATPDSACPVVWGDLLFMVSDVGIVQCLDARTGKLHWKERLPGDYRASPLAAEGRIHFMSLRGLTTIIAAKEIFGKIAENPIDDEVIASPAVSGGLFLIRGRKALRAVRGRAPAAAVLPAGSKVLFDGKTLNGWRIVTDVDFENHGDVHVQDGAIILEKGDSMTGISWTGEMPLEDYEVSLEAARLDGTDFFCGLTFPIGDSPCTLIVGGWGGTCVGLSNVDFQSAVENMTTKFVQFEMKRWYRIRLRVTKERIGVWIDDGQILDLERGKHKFNVWPQQEYVRPFGFDTWFTKGGLRNIVLRKAE